MKKRLISLLMIMVMGFGLFPGGMTVSARQTETAPEAFTVDFMASAQKMAQQTWWDDLPNASAVSSGTSVRGIKYIHGGMNSTQKSAYDSMLAWLEENENWSIDEGYSIISQAWVNKRLHLNAGTADWGLRLWTKYLNEGNYASQLKLKIQAPAEGSYVMKLSVFNENGSINIDGTCGGGYGDLFLGKTQLLDRYHFHSTGNEAVTLNLGVVDLEAGANELLIDMICDTLGANISGDRCAILRNIEFIPVGSVREEVMEGSRLVLDLHEDYVRFDEGISADSHEAVSSDEDIVTAQFNDNGNLVLRGKSIGDAEVQIYADGECICTVFVTVTADPEADVEPVAFKLDFMAGAQKLAQQDFWDALPRASAVSAGTSVEGIRYIHGNMNASQKEAYAQLLDWLSQNENWTINEDKSIFSETWVGKRLHINAGSADWGLRMYTSYLNEGNNASQNVISFTAPAAGIYTLKMSLRNENGSTNIDGSCGGGYGDIYINGEPVCEKYHFYSVADETLTINLGNVELDRGENSLMIDMIADAYHANISGDRAAILRYFEFIPQAERAPEELLVGNRLLLELTNNYVAYDVPVSSGTHEAHSDDETIAEAVLTENGILKIYGRAVGQTRISVTDLEGEQVCIVNVKVNAREGEIPQPVAFKADFMKTVKEMSKQSWWADLKQSSAGAHIRTVGAWINEGDIMTQTQRDAYGEMLQWLDETQNWKIDESRTKLLDDALCKRILFNAGAMDFGLRLHPGKYLNSMPASTFYFVVDAPATGEYNLKLSVHNENGSLNIDTACGGGYGDLYVNGEKVYDRYWFYADTSTVVTLSFGLVELDEGENTIAIDILADRYGGDTIGDTGAILRYAEFTPKTSESLYEFTKKTIDLTDFYLPYDMQISAQTHDVVPENESIVLAQIDENGLITLDGVLPGETSVVLMEGDTKVCTVPVTVLEFNGELDALGGKPVDMDFAAFARKAADQSWWETQQPTEQEKVKVVTDMTSVQNWLDQNLRWNISGTEGDLTVDASATAAGIRIGSIAEFVVDIPANGPYAMRVEGYGGQVDVYVDGALIYEDLSIDGSYNLGAVTMEKGDCTVKLVGTAALKKISFDPLGTHRAELGRDAYVDLTESYLVFDAEFTASVTSGDPKIAAAAFAEDRDLVITGKKLGETELTVTTSGSSFVIPVRVVKAGDLKILNYLLDGFGAITMKAGERAQGELTAVTTNEITMIEKQLRNYGAVYFVSGNTDVVRVDQTTGDVTAVGEGSAEIYAYANLDGVLVKTTAQVVVTDDTDLADMTLTTEVPYLGVSGSMQIKLLGEKKSGVRADMSLYPVTWSVDDPAIAAVSESGKLTGLAPGTVTVTAMAGVRKQAVAASVTVQVIDNRELETSEVYIDMMKDRCVELATNVLEEDGWELNRGKSYDGGSSISYTDANGPRVKLPEGEHFVVDFAVKQDGWYMFELNGTTMPEYLAGASDLYLDAAYMGSVDFRKGPRLGLPAYLIERMNTIYLEAGVHTLDMVCTYAGTMYPSRYILRPVEDPAPMEITVTSATTPLLVGGTSEILVEITDANGNDVLLKNAQGGVNTYYLSSDSNRVSVEGSKIRGALIGTSNVTVTANINGEVRRETIPVQVEEGKILSVQLSAPSTTINPDLTEGVQLQLIAKDAGGYDTKVEGAYYSSKDPSIAQVDENGFVTFGGTLGSVVIEAQLLDGSRTVTGEIWLTFTRGKTEPTLYTYEERAIAQENVTKYNWAWQMKEEAVAKADLYVENVELLYNMWIREGIPRSTQVGYEYDTTYETCRYCKVNLRNIYGHYPWKVDVINNPWKVTCPVCDRDFPSNDFESYYRSGLDTRGYFHPENADPQYLVNELYPEMGEGWGVDDGWGYKGADSAPTYIAHYLHNVFRPLGDFAPHSMFDVLNALRDAYLYTGDEKYGNAGAILLSRMADIYPEYDLNIYPTAEWANADGGAGMGKIVGYVWEADFIAPSMAKGSDAFWDCMDNEEVLEFLRGYSDFMGVTPEEVTPQYLRDKIDNNILLEIKRGCETAQIVGNFGMHQAAMAAAAVSLDRMPESKEMIEWIFREEILAGTGRDASNAGGDIWRYITNQVDRDGLGDEVSYLYNSLLPNDILDCAQILAGYDKVESADLWQNQKFVNFCWSIFKLNVCGNLMTQVGEAGSSVQAQGFFVNHDTMLAAFVHTKDPDIGKAIYAANGNSVDGLHADIFTKDPESGIRSEIARIIEQEGPWNMSMSDMLPGFGIAILREGPEVFHGTEINGKEFFDYWLYFGRTAGAGHEKSDALHIDMEAFGLNLSGNMGYPLNVTGSDPMREQWIRNTASHNTVVVDGHAQSELTWGGEPRHFADNGRVKVMDADATNAYPETDVYRRTVVAVDNGDGVHYAVDFFRILGGSEHVYSFHGATDLDPVTEGLRLVEQPMGSYAGPDVPFGYWNMNNQVDVNLSRGAGFSWLYGVSRDDAPGTSFTVDWDIQDFQKRLSTSSGIHLKLHMVSEKPLKEVALANGQPPQNGANPTHLEYVLVKNSGEQGLDTLFTTVIEPYQYQSYVEKAELVNVTLISGTEEPADKAAAMKITLKNGRVDYVAYATNPNCTYNVAGKFDFRGFTGVVSYEGGKVTYAWGNEATQVADVIANDVPAITGKVVDFTRGLDLEGYTVKVELDQNVQAADFEDAYLYVENNTSNRNAAYRIYGVELMGTTAILDLHTQTLVREMADNADPNAGYTHNISVGDDFIIPLSAVFDAASVLNYTADQVVKTGYRVDLQVGVEGSGATYEIEGLAKGMKFDAATGKITWTPTKTQMGRYPIAVKAVNENGDTLATMEFVIYVVSYTGASYDPAVCKHAKALTYTVDGVDETICPACGTITKSEPEEEPIETIAIAGTNMNLGNELALNFMFPKSLDASKSYTAIITQTSQGKTVKTTEVVSS
ncbi:MAG: pilus assembly protein N-terminal domain-containing protein, partial [Oscillospiraceae bacterium]|nr:pilus assembly protein N-terminal domain-containing protein [Oscillospiraceae bacterium]